jgi:23S rRNA (uracil1939-C5)-methyltransferase
VPDSRPPLPRPKKGTVLDLTIEKFADRGKSLARYHAEGAEEGRGYVVFVAGAVPGDRVKAKLFKRRRGFGEARLEAVVEESALRTAPRCEYFGTCGGCKWQHVEYQAQVEAKRQSVEEAFEHAGGFDLAAMGVTVAPTIAADRPYFYRNKMEFSFSAARWLTADEIATGDAMDRDFALGLHVPGRFDKVLDLKACYLQSEWSVRLVNRMRELAKEHGWAPWHIRDHTGVLRHLVIRQPAHEPGRMVNLVTNGEHEDVNAAVADMLKDEFPEVSTFVVTVNTGKAQTAYGERQITVFGPGVIFDQIGGLRFEIAPNAFFQTNTYQAEKLYAVAAEMADLQPDDLVYDLYCGAGTISLYLAQRLGENGRVVGAELVEEAVENAKRNAEMNGIENATFVSGDMRDLFGEAFVQEHGTPDVVVVDPPRAGLHPKVVGQIANLRPKRLVYVSCNPQTQARDLALLAEKTQNAYSLDALQPVDLFPQTHHVEAVAKLTLKGK